MNERSFNGKIIKFFITAKKHFFTREKGYYLISKVLGLQIRVSETFIKCTMFFL